jgi:hypothetical protein
LAPISSSNLSLAFSAASLAGPSALNALALRSHHFCAMDAADSFYRHRRPIKKGSNNESGNFHFHNCSFLVSKV